jgi:hypothetical protein
MKPKHLGFGFHLCAICEWWPCVFLMHFRVWCLFFKDVHSVDGDVLLCTRVIFNFSMVVDEVVFENMGGINETIVRDMNIVISHSLSNVENVHQQCDHDVFDDMHLQAMELQVQLWKPHNMTSIC